MTTRKISDKKVRTCYKCGESIVERVSKNGKIFFATVYHDGYELVIIVKNGFEVEHTHG